MMSFEDYMDHIKDSADAQQAEQERLEAVDTKNATLRAQLAEAQRERDEAKADAEMYSERATEYWEECGEVVKERDAALERVEALTRSIVECDEANTYLRQRVRKLEGALTPSAETKAAYMGEFSFVAGEYVDDEGEPHAQVEAIPWTAIKDIMKAIKAHAALAGDKEGACQK